MKRFCVILISVLFSATVAIAGAAPDQAISSDGKALAAGGTGEATGVTMVAPSKGSGWKSAEGLAAEGVITESVPMSELLALKPVTAGVGIETIIGWDTRVRTKPNTFPRRATALITFSAGRCTGFFIGANTVVTAGHCVAPGGTGSFYNVTSYRVYPGRDAASSPYGSCTAKRLYSVVGWVNSRLDNYDYGAIKLNCSAGNSTGTFGFYATTASLVNEPTIISGYPGDKTDLSQWESVDKVRINDAKRLFYKNDTIGGMSGSAVWNDRAGTSGPYAIGIHTYGLYNGPPYSTHNHATRIDSSVFTNLVNWRNAP